MTDIAETNHYFDGNFPNAKLRPYDDYKNMSTLNTYCGILSTCHNYKKCIVVDWILCPGKHFFTIFWKFKWRIGCEKYSSLSKSNHQWRKWRALAKSLIVLVNKRADWIVLVSYIKYMSSCSACGFSTKKNIKSKHDFESGHFQTFCYFI